jgi:serine/threonine protein kinase
VCLSVFVVSCFLDGREYVWHTYVSQLTFVVTLLYVVIERSRYWFDQVLNGLENLQRTGICHRDMSLENLLVHKDGALIIDMGMCLSIPYQDGPLSLTASFNSMNMNGAAVANGNHTQQGEMSQKPLTQQPQQTQPLSGRERPRYLIKPQGTCGKWLYMSPEIYENKQPFDGFAVDLWAAGVILFLMMTGECQTAVFL